MSHIPIKYTIKSGLNHFAAFLNVSIWGKKREAALVVRCSKDHSLTFETADGAGLKVDGERKLFSDKSLGRNMKCDAAEFPRRSRQ
jgi:hypothetical protein